MLLELRSIGNSSQTITPRPLTGKGLRVILRFIGRVRKTSGGIQDAPHFFTELLHIERFLNEVIAAPG